MPMEPQLCITLVNTGAHSCGTAPSSGIKVPAVRILSNKVSRLDRNIRGKISWQGAAGGDGASAESLCGRGKCRVLDETQASHLSLRQVVPGRRGKGGRKEGGGAAWKGSLV